MTTLVKNLSKNVLRNPVRTLFVVTDNSDYKTPSKPKYNYRKYGYGYMQFFDSTFPRTSDNTKMVVVTGNMFTGKSTLAQNLAPHFDFMVHEDICDDDLYIFKGPGNVQADLRTHNTILPQHAKYFTTARFWSEPDIMLKGKPLLLQTQYMIYRFYRYSMALCDLLNTGRGQIMAHSPFEEAAISKALFDCGMMSERAYECFLKNHGIALKNTMKPHVVLYLKSSIEQIKERMQQRNLDWELKSPYLNDKFFQAYEDALQEYLESMTDYSEVVVVDRKHVDIENQDDIYILANELTKLDLSGKRIIGDDKKFQDWRAAFLTKYSWGNQRSKISNAEGIFNSAVRFIDIPFDMPEGFYEEEILEIQNYLKKKDERFRYKIESNPKFYNLFQIMFNPFHYPRNFDVDLPKKFITNI